MPHQSTPATESGAASEKADEFIRLQLETDLILDLPDENNVHGPIGPDDDYLVLGHDWTRYWFTGAYYTVREYARPNIEPYADLSLTLDDCITGLTRILDHLTTLDTTELASTADGAFRARRHLRQIVEEPTGRPAGKLAAPAPRDTDKTRLRTDRKFALDVHVAQTAINALRHNETTPETEGTTAQKPKNLTLLVQAWLTYYVTAFAHMMGGPQTDAMAEVADPTLSPAACVAGLNRIRDRISQLDLHNPYERKRVFVEFDHLHDTYIPEFLGKTF